MTTLLAIETSTDACSVALGCDGVIQETVVIRPREHNQVLLGMVDDMLKGLRLTFADLDAIAFGAGPGSFTGLRLSAGVVQGLAFSTNKPVIPVSSLAALAFSAGDSTGSHAPQNIVTVVDARMQEVYFGAFQFNRGSLGRLAEDTLLPVSRLADFVRNIPDPMIIGDGWPSGLPMPSTTRPAVTVHPHARAVLALAKERFNAGDTVTAEQALPVYLRDTVSWQKWQPKSNPKKTNPAA